MKAVGGLHDLLASERGVFAIFLIIVTTAWVMLGKMSIEDWISYSQWIGVALIASKTATGIVETVVNRVSPPPAMRVVKDDQAP